MRREADFPGEPTTIGELMRTPQTTPTRDEAADFLRRLRAANVRRDAEYRAKTQGEPLPLLFRTTEFAGEVGELLNVVKKIERERLGWAGKRADRQMLLEEFGGVVATLDLLAMMLDVDLATATADEFNAVSDRLSLTTKLASAPAPASGGVEQNEKGPADFSTGPLRDHDPVATAATPVSEDSEPSSYSTTTDRAKPTPVSEAGGEPDMWSPKLEAIRLLKAEDTRQLQILELLETIREQVRLGVKPEHRPDGLMKNLQTAVYGLRGRMPLLNDAAIMALLQALAKPASSPAGGDES